MAKVTVYLKRAVVLLDVFVCFALVINFSYGVWLFFYFVLFCFVFLFCFVLFCFFLFFSVKKL